MKCLLCKFLVNRVFLFPLLFIVDVFFILVFIPRVVRRTSALPVRLWLCVCVCNSVYVYAYLPDPYLPVSPASSPLLPLNLWACEFLLQCCTKPLQRLQCHVAIKSMLLKRQFKLPSFWRLFPSLRLQRGCSRRRG